MKMHLAERAGRWSAAHWKTATFGWLAFVIVAVVLGQLVGTAKLTDAENATGESARAEAALSASGIAQALVLSVGGREAHREHLREAAADASQTATTVACSRCWPTARGVKGAPAEPGNALPAR